MTNLPSFFTTAGLKVPADSNPLPSGETMGSGESRVHFPKGGENWAAATAATERGRTTQARAKRPVTFVAFVILGILLPANHWIIPRTLTTRLPSLTAKRFRVNSPPSTAQMHALGLRAYRRPISRFQSG